MSWLGELIEKNSSDPRQRLELGQQLLAQLQTSRLPSDSTLLNDFCDLVVQWLSASNFKVALLAVEILDVAIEVSGDVLAPYLVERTSALLERLGDSKQSVRDAAVQLITTMANTPHCSPQTILEKISPGLVHRQWLVRIGTMQVIRNILEQHKLQVETQINRVIPTLCKLMGDPTSEVRDAAANALVNIFCQLGDHVPTSIRKRQLIPESKFQMLMARYNEAQQGGGLAPSTPSTSQRMARPLRRPLVPQKPSFPPHFNNSDRTLMFKKPLSPPPSAAGRGMASRRRTPFEEQENAVSSTPVWQRASSVPAHKRPIAVTAKNTGTAGSVSDEAFRKAFIEVPKCDIFSIKELKEKIATACSTLENPNVDWDRRVGALKMLRAIIIGGALDVSDFSEELRDLERSFLTSVKDLRSQVCREACVTIAYFCERLEMKMVPTIEALMPTLTSLLQNSAKVMATSSQLALQYAIKYVRSTKILLHLQTGLASKSREIRRNVASLLLMALTLWDERLIEKNMSVILDCIKAALSDADPETRNTGKNLFVQLDQDYKQQADILYKTLDASKQRTLSGYVSQSSSSQSIVSEKDSLPMSQRSSSYALHKAAPSYYAGRSTSDIDPGAARRAISRVTRATPNKYGGPLQQVNGITSASQMRTPVASQRFVSGSQRAIPTRRPAGTPTPTSVVRSQPGSRSTSPSSRLPTRLPPRNSLTGNGRMRSQTEDLEDGASVSSDSFSRFETAELASALACCAATSISERKEGLKALFNILSNEKQISPIDLRKIVERINNLIGEGSHKLLQSLSDVLVALIRNHHEELSDWLNHLIPRLIMKFNNDVLSSNQEKYRVMLDAVRQYFDPEKQMHAVCKFIQDPIRNNVHFKIKHGLLVYLHELMKGMDSAPSMNQSEVRQAINKIFQWVDDPKNAGLINISEEVVCDMFHLNASDFTSMMATFPNELKDRLQAIIRKNSLARKCNGSGDAHAGILETTAQINEFVEGRMLPTSPLRSPPGQHGNGFFRSPLENGGTRRLSREEAGGNLSGYVLNPEALANDLEQQEELITKIGEELSLHNQRTAERLRAMSVLSQVTRDNLFSLWDKHFKMILLLLVETLKDDDWDIRRMALKLLKEICYSQASRFNVFAEMALMRVLDATVDENKFVVSAAEDCGTVLATHLSSAVCRKVLLAVIKSDVAEPKIYMAIKMLTKVISSLSPEELEAILDEVAPLIVDTYNYENSSIRKESVGCLVAMHRIVGQQAMAPYTSKLNKGKLELLNVYLRRWGVIVNESK